MRRLARLVGKSLIGLSLLAAVGLVCARPRMRRVVDMLTYVTPSDTGYRIQTSPGGIRLSVQTHCVRYVELEPAEIRPTPGWSFRSATYGVQYWLADPSSLSFSPASTQPNPSSSLISGHQTSLRFGATEIGVLGFECVRATYPSSPLVSRTSFATHLAQLVVPVWFVVSLLATPATVSVLRACLRGRRRSAGLCPVCDYDLRYSPHRCPECGTPTLNPKAPTT